MSRQPRDRETDRAALTAAATRLLAGTPAFQDGESHRNRTRRRIW